MMREVLNKLWENDVKGPQLFRLDSEFGLAIGEGTQFRVSGPSANFKKKVQHARKLNQDTGTGSSLVTTLDSLSSSVVKRARWIPDPATRRQKAEVRAQKLSRQDLTKELHSQLLSAKKEIDRLCHTAYRRHPNIVQLRGWGLCLDTFEAETALNTRIPLLILERATCDLEDFLASSNYKDTSYETLVKLCSDIGTGLGALHRGDVTHGDMKPENVLLFAEWSSDLSKFIWTAKLCDFGSGEAKVKGSLKSDATVQNPDSHCEFFPYDGTPGWTPPEALFDQQLDLEALKRCDIFVYGLIVWRIFGNEKARSEFDVHNNRRKRPPGRRLPVNERKIGEYLKDRAYKDAAAEIREATIQQVRKQRGIVSFLQKSFMMLASFCKGQIPSREDAETIKDASSPGQISAVVEATSAEILCEDAEITKDAPTGDKEIVEEVRKIPSEEEMLRILKVLRTALQPVPRFRDTRPWKYLDKIYYQNIPPFNENPGQEQKDISFAWLAGLISVLPNVGIVDGVAKGQRAVVTMVERLGVAYAYSRSSLPSLILKSPFQKMFKSVFALVSSDVALGWDLNSIATVEHAGVSCYDISLFRSRLFGCCSQAVLHHFPDTIQELYSYARLRSRFKLCCWQNGLMQCQPCNALELLLCHEDNPWPIESSEHFFRAISWLSRGEIGEHELKSIAGGANSSHLWARTFADRMTDFPDKLFHLLLERGCYVGCEVGPSKSFNQKRSDTALSRYLRRLVEGFNDINTKSGTYDTIISVCAKVKQTSQLCLSLEAKADVDGIDVLEAKMRFFFRGESPDYPDDELSTTREAMKEIKSTTILHEAVISCCYAAVEYFVRCSAIPTMVRDRNEETAFELALRMKESNLESWQLSQINTILGLLAQNSKLKNPGSDLPLGWEEIEFGQGLVVFCESTINPNNPSLTFKPPKFSLLQETQIALGSRKSASGGLTYKFDLVRFIHQSRVDDSKRDAFYFGEEWYKADIKNLEDESKSYLYEMALKGSNFFFDTRYNPGLDDRRIWIRGLAIFGRAQKVVLLRSYLSVLLVLVPFSIILKGENWHLSNPLILLSLAFCSTLPLLDILETTLRELGAQFISVLSGLGDCAVEICVRNKLQQCLHDTDI